MWIHHHFWMTAGIALLVAAMASEAWIVLLAYMLGSINLVDPRRHD